MPAPGEAFDSNCITPGTAFMGRLNEHLRFFVRRKLAEDPAWQRPRVVLSGAPLGARHALQLGACYPRFNTLRVAAGRTPLRMR